MRWYTVKCLQLKTSVQFACLWIFLCLFNKVTVGIPVMPSSEGKEDHDWWNNPCGGNKIGVEKPSTNRSEILGAIDTALSQYLLINSTFIPAANFSRLWTQTPQFVNDDIINETKNMALPDNAKTLSKSFNEDITADLILNLKGNITEVLKEPLCNAYNHMLLNAYRIEFLNMTNENELNKITPFTNPDLEDLRNHFYDIKRLYANLMCYFHSCLTKLGYKTEPLSEEDKQNVRETKSENSYFGWLVYREVINCVENVENILSAVKENINNSSLYFS